MEEEFAETQALAGVATAGIPHAAFLAHQTELPMIYVRGEAKKHGRQNRIEGELAKGTNVLVIEDLISTGASATSAVEALRAAGLNIVGVLSIFDYGFQVARKAFEKAGVRSESLCNLAALLTVAERRGELGPDELELIMEWQKNPANWSPNTV